MAQDLRVDITGDESDFARAMLAAIGISEAGARAIKKNNASVAGDAEKTGKRIKNAWYDAERGLVDFKRSTEVLASAISTTRGGPINSLTRGIGNVILATGKMADAMQNALKHVLPATGAAEKAGGALENLGLSMSDLAPIIGGLIGILSALSAALLVLPAVAGGVVFAFTALLETVTILGAGLLALAAPVTVVTALLGGLGAAFVYVTAQSIKNKATQQQVHDNLLKLHVAQQTYNEDVVKYGKSATQTENALLALHKAQDTYEASQLGLALSTAKIQGKFHSLVNTLAHDFRPQILFLVNDASKALSYLDRIAKLPLAAAFKSLSTTGVTGVTHFIQQIGFMLAKPFRLAIKFGFGVGGDTLSSQVKALYAELANFLTGPNGALNPVVAWFHRQDFTETGIRWAHEIIDGLVGLWNNDKAFRDSVKTVLADAAHQGWVAFMAVLKFELGKLGEFARSSFGHFAAAVAIGVIALAPLISALKIVGSAARVAWLAVGKGITVLTEAALGNDAYTASTIAASAAADAEAASATAAAVATARAGAAAAGASVEETALAAASTEASLALDGVAVSAEGATAAEGGGLLAGLAAGATAAIGPLALVAANIAAIVLIARGANLGPFGKTEKGGFSPIVLAQMKRDGVTVQQVNQAIAQSAITMADDIDRARTASDRLFGALNHLKDVKLSLKTDKISLQLDQLAVKEDKLNLKNLLGDSNSTPLEIKRARLTLQQQKIQVQTDKQITIPYDKQQIEAARAYINKQLGAIRNDFRDTFRAASDKEFNLHPFESKQHAIQGALNLTHGALIRAATGAVEFANKIRKNDPAQATFKLHVAAMALAVDDLTQKIGHAPTQKQINIYYKHNLDDLIRQAKELGASIDHLQSKSLSINTTFRTFHINSGPSQKPSEAGGDVRAGDVRMTGERGRELFVPGMSGTILPHAETEKIMRAAAAMAGGYENSRAANDPQIVTGGGGTSLTLEQKIHKRFNDAWDYVGHRFFSGYNKPHVKLVDHLLKYNGRLTDGETLPGSVPRDIIFSTNGRVGAFAHKAARYSDFKDEAMQLMLHEMAHAYQKPSLSKAWQREGGAEAFSWRLLPHVLAALGINNSGAVTASTAAEYPGFLAKVRNQKKPVWQLFDQFSHTSPVPASTEAAYIQKYRFQHGYGGNAWPGQVSLVGENGPELRYENNAARYIPATDTKRALAGMGGETHLHFHFPNAVIVDAKSVDQAARAIKPSLDRLAGRR